MKLPTASIVTTFKSSVAYVLLEIVREHEYRSVKPPRNRTFLITQKSTTIVRACQRLDDRRRLELDVLKDILVRHCPGGETGRHKGLKIPREKSCAGSTPAPGTILLR